MPICLALEAQASTVSINQPYPIPGQISILPKPELRGFWGDSLTKPPFRVTSAEVAIICPNPTRVFSTILLGNVMMLTQLPAPPGLTPPTSSHPTTLLFTPGKA